MFNIISLIQGHTIFKISKKEVKSKKLSKKVFAELNASMVFLGEDKNALHYRPHVNLKYSVISL